MDFLKLWLKEMCGWTKEMMFILGVVILGITLYLGEFGLALNFILWVVFGSLTTSLLKKML